MPTAPTGAYTEIGYWDNLLRQTTTVKRDVVNSVDQLVASFQDTDGAGRVIRKGGDHPNGGSGKFSGQQFKYDVLGRGSEASQVLAVTSSFDVDTTEPGQYSSWQWTAAEFDGLGRTTAVEKPDNTYLFTDYSVCGCAGGLVTTNYDERGNQKLAESDFLGRLKYAREYDPNYSYDENSQLYIASYTFVSQAEYVYDVLDRLVNINHTAAGTGTAQVRSFSYDNWGRPLSETTPEAGTVSYTYTANDQVATTTDANGKTATVQYNTRNLVTSVSYNDSGATPGVSYAYDDYGARTSMTDGEGTMSYTYNSYRQLSSETRTFTGLPNNNYTFNYSYTLAGQLTQANYVAPSFNKNINYAYKVTGALASLGTNLIGSDGANTTNVVASLDYYGFGKPRQVVYANDRKQELSYVGMDLRVYQRTMTRGNGTDKIEDYQYQYTENGLISGLYDALDIYNYRKFYYNGRNQLTALKYPPPPPSFNWDYWSTVAYGYDAWGNYVGRSTGGWYSGPWSVPNLTFNYPKIGSSQTPATNRASSVVTDGVTTNLSYDNAGNMTQAGTTTYEWDAANRLKSVNSGALGSYGYDGNGKRVKKTEGSATTYYVYSSVLGSAVLEVASTGVQRAYVMNGSSVVAQLNPNGNFYWLHVDHLGSSRMMTDTSGAVVYRAEFEPYGRVISEWSSPSNLTTKKFTGYERDAATGLDYAQARMYNSEWGRFLSPDPLGLGAARMMSPKSLNRYSYTEGNPVNFVDPSGLLLQNPDDPRDVGPANGSCGTGFMCPGIHSSSSMYGSNGDYTLVTRLWFVGGVVGTRGSSGSGTATSGRKGNNLPPCLLDFLGQYKELKGVDIEKVMMFPNSLPSADITNISAVTIGNNIFFAGGQYNLTYNGIALIAHELFHVKQYQDAGSVGKFLQSYFSEFKANLEKRVGTIDDFPTIPSLGGEGLDEATPFLMKLGVVLGRLKKSDVDAAYSDISYEVAAREFQNKVRRDVEANGSPCIP